MIIAIDFDGTIVTHEYPEIGTPVPGALDVMKQWQEHGHQLILWTMRSGDKLTEAIHYLNMNGIVLYGANINPTQSKWTDSPKAYAQVYIDDTTAGCPLIYPAFGRAYVDWKKIGEMYSDGFGKSK